MMRDICSAANPDTVMIHCPVCGRGYPLSESRRLEYSTAQRSAVTPRWISFCPSCQVGIAFPLLSDEEIDRLYADGDYWRSYKVEVLSPHKFPGQYAMAEARWEFVRHHLVERSQTDEGLAILDIGAGHGFFGLAACASRSAKIRRYVAVERDQFYQQSLRLSFERAGQGTCEVVDSLEKCEGAFDVIVLSHILEHLKDPKAMLAVVKDRLAAGGCVFIDLPHEDYIFKTDVFPHLLFFNPRSVSELLTQAGFSVRAVQCFGRDREPIDRQGGRGPQWRKTAERLVYKLRRAIPIGLSKYFYFWYFGGKNANENGTWIRALACNA